MGATLDGARAVGDLWGWIIRLRRRCDDPTFHVHLWLDSPALVILECGGEPSPDGHGARVLGVRLVPRALSREAWDHAIASSDGLPVGYTMMSTYRELYVNSTMSVLRTAGAPRARVVRAGVALNTLEALELRAKNRTTAERKT